jgi:hypothetical protein
MTKDIISLDLARDLAQGLNNDPVKDQAKHLLWLEIQGVGPGWQLTNQIVGHIVTEAENQPTSESPNQPAHQPAHRPNIDKALALHFETAYPTAEGHFMVFFTGAFEACENAKKLAENSELKKYIKAAEIFRNARALLEGSHHLRTPNDVKSLIVIESKDPKALLAAAEIISEIDESDLIEIHLSRTGTRGGHVYTKWNKEIAKTLKAQAGINSSAELTVTEIPNLEQTLKELF